MNAKSLFDFAGGKMNDKKLSPAQGKTFTLFGMDLGIFKRRQYIEEKRRNFYIFEKNGAKIFIPATISIPPELKEFIMKESNRVEIINPVIHDIFEKNEL
jgi:hypothetical protein